MKRFLLYFCTLLAWSTDAFTQGVGIGTTTPSTSAILEIKSSTKGLIFPRTSTSSRNAMTGVKGLFVYDTTASQVFFHNGSSWQQVATGAVGSNYWTLSGSNIYSNNSGNVGIGMTNPSQKLSVNGNAYFTGNPPSLYIEGSSTATTARIFFDLVNSSNTMDFLIMHFDDKLYLSRQTGAFGFMADFVMNDQGYIGLSVADPLTRLHIDDGTDVGNASGGFIQLGASNANNIGIDDNEIQGRFNGAVSRLVLNNGGGPVQIGSAVAPAGYILAVNGKAICEELKIQDSTNWPDYVFGEEYELHSLSELRDYIHQHHHLPNIPSANEIAEEGIMIGDMQKKMMEKIEELTLYILQLEETMTSMSDELAAVKANQQ